ncbi:MAG: SRPBCC family protein [Actinomycetota bacterium]|nr:SRPBCC family protein [Actinomycetota bacterium]
MSDVKAEIEIAAPIDTVWETIMDPARLKDWVTIHKSVKNASPTPLKSGSTMEQCMVVRGVSFTVHWTLATVAAPELADWEGTGPARSQARISYALSEVDGRTRFVYSNEFHPPGGRLGKVAGRFIVGATSEREAKNSLARLKRLLEK